jgi:hypothetical protein
MKYILIILLLPFISVVYSQTSDEMVPKDAVTVFSINNISLLKKISMDSLIQYDFMEEVQTEMFDGSADDKSLKDAGIDFDQKINVFYGRTSDYEVSGFSFGIKDRDKLLGIFDDYEKIDSPIDGISYYNSFFNHLIFRQNGAMIIRVDPSFEKVKHLTDSIWAARGNGYFYDNAESKEEYEEDEELEEIAEEDVFEEEEEEESDEAEIIEPQEEAKSNLSTKTYWEIKDSITAVLQTRYTREILKEMFEKNIHLKNQDRRFEEQLSHTSEGMFYLDNGRNFQYSKGLWYFQSMFPELFRDIKNLYAGNVILGDIHLKNDAIELKFQANYNQDLGKIYEKLNDSKFDKKVLDYIHKDCSGFFTYNINLKEGYKQAYEILIPMLRKEKDPRVTSNVLKAELLNEFINTDAVFETYQGSMFGSFNGIKKVNTKRIEFTYDENTFEYQEKEVAGEEDMPMFTIGFSTGREDISNKVMDYLSKMSSRFKQKKNYWIIEDAIFNSIPVYVINSTKGLLIITNDENLAVNHTNGYGKDAIKGVRAKNAKKSKLMYGYVNIGEVITKVPTQVFNTKQNEIVNSMRGKEGYFELTTSKTSVSHTDFEINYYFEGNYSDSGIYLLDLINSAYILAK